MIPSFGNTLTRSSTFKNEFCARTQNTDNQNNASKTNICPY